MKKSGDFFGTFWWVLSLSFIVGAIVNARAGRNWFKDT